MLTRGAEGIKILSSVTPLAGSAPLLRLADSSFQSLPFRPHIHPSPPQLLPIALRARPRILFEDADQFHRSAEPALRRHLSNLLVRPLEQLLRQSHPPAVDLLKDR